MSSQGVFRSLLIMALTALFVPAGFGQTSGGGTTGNQGGNTGGTTGGSTGGTTGGSTGGTTGGASGGNPGSAGRTPDTGPSSGPSVPDRSGRGGIGLRLPPFLMGRVLQEDGTPPDQRVKIERVCSGFRRTEGYTDSKGYFTVTLRDSTSAFQDASVKNRGEQGNNASSPQDLSGCELRAEVSGFRSQTINLADPAILDRTELGVMLVHRITPEEGSMVSVRSLGVPKNAKKALQRGEDQLRRKHVDQALTEFQKALELYPGYATAWSEIGKIEMAQGQVDAAHKSFTGAIKADPKFVDPYIQLSLIALILKNWQDLIGFTTKAVQLDSFDYPQAFFLNAVGNYNLRNFDDAQKSIERAAKLDTQHRYPQIAQLEGWILVQRGDYHGAVECFQRYLKLVPDSPDAINLRRQLAEIEKMAGTRATNAGELNHQ